MSCWVIGVVSRRGIIFFQLDFRDKIISHQFLRNVLVEDFLHGQGDDEFVTTFEEGFNLLQRIRRITTKAHCLVVCHIVLPTMPLPLYPKDEASVLLSNNDWI